MASSRQMPQYYDKSGGLYLAQVNPYGIHVESMESISNSMWNPWNECWLRPQPICCSMDIMDSIWNDHGMVMEWSIPYGIHCYSTWIPYGIQAYPPWIPWTSSYGFHGTSLHGFHGQVHMDSMEQVHMDSMEQVHMDSNWNSRKQVYILSKIVSALRIEHPTT